MLASDYGYTDIVECLLSKDKIDVNIQNIIFFILKYI